jgi:hypothetical protein
MKAARILLLFVIVSGCAPATLPPDVKPAFTANEVLIRVNELQKTVIELYDSEPKGITKERAELIVFWCVQTAKTLREIPAGWQKTVVATWDNLLVQIKVPEGGLQTVWTIVDTLMKGLK